MDKKFSESGASLAARVITKSNTVDLEWPARAIHVSAAGDVKIIDLTGHEVVVPGVPQGIWAQGAQRIFTTGTTATVTVAYIHPLDL